MNKSSIDTNPAQKAATQAWGTKLLAIALCIISFFAGWKSYQYYQADACLDSGGKVTVQHGIDVCEW